MMRTTTSLIATFWLFLFTAASAVGAESGLLWQVSGKGAEAYLFGTMHSEDPRVLALPEPVERRFKHSDTVVLEVELDAQAEMATAMKMMLPAEQSLSQLVGKSLADKTKKAMLSRNIPPEITERFQPWALVLVLSMPEQVTGLALDMVLYQRALEEGKQFKALESVDEQLAIFTGLTLAEQKSMLSSVLEEYQTYPELFEQMTQAYLARDLERLAELSEATSMGDEQLAEKVMQRMLEDRNHRMVQRLQPILKQGRVFIAVGALHLHGEEGLVSLLRQQGYTTKLLY